MGSGRGRSLRLDVGPLPEEHGELVEVVERADAGRPLYVGCQFHPEYTSSPFAPHPLVVGWLRAAAGKRA